MGARRRAGLKAEPEIFETLRSLDDDAQRTRWLRSEGLLAARPELVSQGAPIEGIESDQAPDMGAQLASEQALLSVLERNGVPVILAGPTLAAWTQYASPAWRVRDWLDLLIHARDVNEARTVLRAEGFSPDPRATARTESAQAWRRGSGSARMGVRLRWDLCDHPVLNRRFSIAGLKAKSVILEKPVRGLRGLGAEHAVLFGALRWVDGVRERFRLVDLLDQDLRWRALKNEQIGDLALLSRQRGVAGILAEHLDLTATAFGTPVSAELMKSLRQSGKHERSLGLLKARGSSIRYHALGALHGRGLRTRGRHLLSLLAPGRRI